MTAAWRILSLLILIAASSGSAHAQGAQAAAPAEIDWLELAMGGIAGLVLFLCGVSRLSGGALKKVGSERARDWLARAAGHRFRGLLSGTLATVTLNSSSVTFILLITLAGEGLIGLPAGIAIMLGAEIATCADTLAATLGRSPSAVRAGLFHLFFNVVTVALGVLFIHQFAAFAQMWTSEVGHQIANAHVAFNVGGALLFIGFTQSAAAIPCRIVPARGDEATAPAAQPAG